jgi:alkanesulfonate monooxygenase SsuD/methylene tetrahydromethanopterin reductase-like flavin-dependent oxidoreductase (luciferase family)
MPSHSMRTKMRVGIGLPNTNAGADRDRMINWARAADLGPFSSLAVLDRVTYGSLEPMTVLAAASAVTERVRLATMIVIGPIRNTTMLAKEAATIDVLSGGRLTLGIAIGARKDDYNATDGPFHTRGDVLTHQLGEMRRLWTGDDIGPKPVQEGGPQILVGGMTDIAYARVARFADGFAHNGGPPRVFAAAADKVRAAWSDGGRPGRPLIWGQGYFALGDDVVEPGRDYLRDYYAFTGPFAEKIAQGMLTTPQAILQFVRGYEDAGCDELVLFPTSARIDQLERLADVLG